MEEKRGVIAARKVAVLIKGRYSVPCRSSQTWGTDEKFAVRWSGIVEICRTLDRDKADYKAYFELRGVAREAWFVIEVSGGQAKALKPKTSARVSPPALKTLKQCQKELADAERELKEKPEVIRRIMRNNLQITSRYGPRTYRRAEKRKFGRALAVLMADLKKFKNAVPTDLTVPQSVNDYKRLDSVFGFKVLRVSKMDTREKERGYWETLLLNHGGHYVKKEQDARQNFGYNGTVMSTFRAWQNARIDAEYWREMVRLVQSNEQPQERN